MRRGLAWRLFYGFAVKEVGGQAGAYAVLVGASVEIDSLRRDFMRDDVPHLGAVHHLRGLRRRLVLGTSSFVAVCVSLDDTTRERYAVALPVLLADLRGLPGIVRSVGLVPSRDRWREAAQLGCDAYAHDASGVAAIIDMMRREDYRNPGAPRASQLAASWWRFDRLRAAPSPRFDCFRLRGMHDPMDEFGSA